MNKISIGIIDENAVANFESALAKVDSAEPLVLDIHSEGGSVLDGFRIGELLKEYEGRTVARINVAAFSMASYIAALCDEVEIKSVGYVMIHNPYSMMQGDDDDLASQAEVLKSMKESMVLAYMQKMDLSESEVKALMKAETYFNSAQAVEFGFADRVIGEGKVEAKALAFAKLFDKKKEPIMAKTIATPADVRKKFPKASAEFILKCVEKQFAMEEVVEEMAMELEEEHESMEEELAKAKARIAELEEELAKAKAQEDEEEMGKANARRTGVAPVRQAATATAKSVREEWDEAVKSYMAKGMSKQRALMQVNRDNPELRQRYVASVNC
jgi:ATP-dependent protease ClpP protease subunit